VQVKLCLAYPLTLRAKPERLRDASYGGAKQIDYLYLLRFSRQSTQEEDKYLKIIIKDLLYIGQRQVIADCYLAVVSPAGDEWL